MSTHIYLQCNSHIPHMKSWDQVGNTVSDIPNVFRMIENRQALLATLEIVEDDTGYEAALSGWTGNAARFFKHHPECDVHVVDEYGRLHEKE